MTSINDVRLVGVLTKTPEIRETAQNKKFARLEIETEEFLRINGETKRIAQVHTVICFNQFSVPYLENVGQGTRVKVAGKLTYGKDNKAEIMVTQYTGEVAAMDPEGTGSTTSRSAGSAEVKTNTKPGGGLGKLAGLSSGEGEAQSSKPSPRKMTQDEEDDEIPF